MAYSQVGIINLALSRIGKKGIAVITEDSTQAIKARAAWEYILYEVLEARDWKFAKRRIESKSMNTMFCCINHYCA